MASSSRDEDDSSEIHIQKKQRTEGNTCSAMMYFDVLDCPVCFEPLTVPIFQVTFHIVYFVLGHLYDKVETVY